MYLLYLDESGTHGGSPAFVLSGLAIHEQDAWHFQRKLHGMLQRRLPRGHSAHDFELHAAEMMRPVKRVKGRKVYSPWAKIPFKTRLDIMRAGFSAITSYTPQDASHPFALFGAVIDQSYKDREKRAYEEVLHKFDEMLTRQARASGTHERGIVIHDRRMMVERGVQAWAATWRQVAGRIGVLTHLSDVPFFADSRASRLIQAADFVTYGLWRFYGPSQSDEWARSLWPHFDNEGGRMHGLIHVYPGFRRGLCQCPPCVSRTRTVATP